MLVTFAVTLLAALLASLTLTPFVRAIARRFGLVVRPRDDRWHTVATALYGGVAIAVAAALAVPIALSFQEGLLPRSTAPAILTAALSLFVIGVVDDARGMSPVAKLIAQIGGGSILVWSGVIVSVTPWLSVNVLVTLFWFVGITNALNLLDNMDGIAAGVAAVASFAFAALFWHAGDGGHAILALAVAGSALGFLVFNFKPASIFMGDAGSLFLGASLAGLGASYTQVTSLSGPAALLAPVLVLIVPIVDTMLVTVARVLNNRSIAAGGRDHTTHRLVRMGFSESRTAIFLYACSACAGTVAFAIANATTGTALWTASVILTIALVFAAYLGTLYKYVDSKLAPRGRVAFLREILLRRRGFVVLLDAILFGIAYYGAFVVYYWFDLPAHLSVMAAASIGMVIVLKTMVFNYCRVYRIPWAQSTLADVHRIVKAVVLSTLLLVTASFLLSRGALIPRTVFVLDMLMSGVFTLGARTSFASLERVRSRLRAPVGAPMLIYIGQVDASLALAAITAHPELELHPVGFLSDTRAGEFVNGMPIVAPDVARDFAERFGVQVVLTGGREETDSVQQIFAAMDIRVVQLHVDFTPTVMVAGPSGSQSANVSGR